MNWHVVWIIGFLVLLFIVSIASLKKVKSADGYLMGDFKMGFFPICGSVIATVTGSAALIGGAAQGFNLGVSYAITVISFVLFTIAAMLVLGPTIRKLKLYTVPDLFSRRFGRRTALIPALIIAFLYMTPTFGMQLTGMASITTSIMGWDYIQGILLAFVVVMAFTWIGGLPSVAWTDAIQTLVILLGVFLTFVFGLIYVGGPVTLIEETPAEMLSFGSIGWLDMVNWFLVFGPFYIVWQTTWQRMAAARTVRIGMTSIIVGFIISGLIGVMAVLIGIMGLQVFPEDSIPDSIYTMFIVTLFPDWIGGLLMVSLLAALLTGATSFLLSGAINISKDIYHNLVNPHAEDRRILSVSRWSVAVMAVIGLLIALTIQDIIAIYQIALSYTAATIVAPVLAAMFWKRATKKGVIASLVASLVVTTIWNFLGQPFGLHEIAPGLFVSFVVLIAVSLLTTHSDDEVVTAYYFDIRAESNAKEKALWNQ